MNNNKYKISLYKNKVFILTIRHLKINHICGKHKLGLSYLIDFQAPTPRLVGHQVVRGEARELKMKCFKNQAFLRTWFRRKSDRPV